RSSDLVSTTTPEKRDRLQDSGFPAFLIDFDQDGSGMPAEELASTVFDLSIVSVPITRKDDMDRIRRRFANLTAFLRKLRFRQAVFFGSVGIYPHEDGLVHEDTYPEERLEQRLLHGERSMRSVNPGFNILRLGGLFGLNRVFAKYFQDKVCATGAQTANFVHVDDIYGVIVRLMESGVSGATYNVVCPEHPLKKDVIEASAAKYGYELPSGYEDTDQTAKRVGSDRIVRELDYAFAYASPLDF